MYKIFVIFLTILLASPGLLDNIAIFPKCETGMATAMFYYVIKACYVIASSTIVSYITCYLTDRLCSSKDIIKRTILVAITGLCFIFSFADIVMMRVFNRRFSALDIELIKLTNQDEANSFLSTYAIDPTVITIALTLFCMFVLSYIIAKVLDRFNILDLCIKSLIISTCTLSLLFYVKEVFTPDTNELYKYRGLEDPIANAVKEYFEYNSLNDQVNTCAKNQSFAEVDSCNFTSKNIVVVIGESFNRHHSSLYGYPLKTNPLLEKQENLYLFDDVIAPENTTIREFHNFLSMASVDSKEKWFECPLLPTIMRRAGYKVFFYSNQFPKEQNKTGALSGQFLNDDIVDSLAFDFRNVKTYQYDLELIDEFKKDYASKCSEHNLIFLHLQGQHVRAQDKYPEEFSRFNAKDIKRNDLNDSQRQMIAYYDNATLYNDYVVKSIFDFFNDKDAIVAYFADHGDEVNDFRIHVGRSFDFDNGANMLTNQLDIPFMFYLSEEYKAKHPNIEESIVHRSSTPFMIDDLPHIILGLAGVSCQWYNPQKDLLNNDFDSRRTRLVGQNHNFDYDKICN